MNAIAALLAWFALKPMRRAHIERANRAAATSAAAPVAPAASAVA